MENKIVTDSPEKTLILGRKLVASLSQIKSNVARIICLSGPLGSGKSTLVSGIANELGIHKRILSPTFLLAKQYQLPSGGMFYHLDLYRLSENNSIGQAEFAEWIVDNKSWMVIEWPERLKFVPLAATYIFCEELTEENHQFTFPFLLS